MTSSRWDAQGNIYLVTEESLTPDAVRAEVGDADGMLEVFRFGDDWLEIAIWNPDGSRAEMSGNGTRIAARWLAERTGAPAVEVRVGERVVGARMLDEVRVEQDLGEVVVSAPEEAAGIRFVAVDVGNPHAVVDGDPADLLLIGPLLEVHERFPRRTNVQVARVVADPGVLVSGLVSRAGPPVLVSGDRHLTGLSAARPPVLTPRAFADLLDP